MYQRTSNGNFGIMQADTDLRGVICAAVTPVTGDGDIDIGRLARHCRVLLDDGCSFISTFGTTGEGASLSSAQKAAALRGLAAAGVPMARLVPAVMSSNVDDAGQLLRAIADLGCRAALMLPPFYYSTATEAGIVDYFAAVLARAGGPKIDLMLYHIPALSRIAFTHSLIDQLLARFGARVVGLKDSTGDVDNSVRLARAYPQLSIFTGDDRVLPHLMRAGGAGMIGGLPNLFARDLVALQANVDAPTSPDLITKSSARIVAVDSNGGLIALKALVARRYEDVNFARTLPPLVGFDPAQTEALASALTAVG